MLIRTADGSYIPSFFSMYIDSDEPIMESVTSNQQTFAHEYLHFLQDLILPYCMRETVLSLSQFSVIHRAAIESGKLSMPFTAWDADSLECRKQTSYTWGDSEFFDYVPSIKSFSYEYFTMNKGVRVFRYKVIIDSGDQYQIGARDFLEYLAHKVENCYWPCNAPDFPYRTIDRVFEHFDLDWLPEQVRLCIVEYCLYNDNPIRLLISCFIEDKLIENNTEKFQSYEACRDFLLTIGWNSYGGFSDNIFTKTERRSKQLKEMLYQKYKHEFYGDIIKWIDIVIAYSKMHFSNGFYISSLYGLAPDTFASRIRSVIDDIGIPFISNRINESACLLPDNIHKNDLLQFYVLGKFIEYIGSPERQCPLLNICKVSNPGVQRNECLNNPFIVPKDDSLDCSFWSESYLTSCSACG